MTVRCDVCDGAVRIVADNGVTSPTEGDADVDALAAIAANTAYELYEHYGAGEDYESFGEFAVDVAFQADEVDAWLDERD